MTTVSANDFERLEGTVNKIADAVSRLVLLEERQSVQRHDFESLREEMDGERDERLKVSQRLDKWINMGVGAWAVVVAVFTILTTVYFHEPDKYTLPPTYSTRQQP